MITSFDCKETEKIFNGQYSKKFPKNIQRIAMRKLWIIDSATNLTDLKVPPGNNLKKLKSNTKTFSIRVNNQFRITFQWTNNNATNVKITDYH